MPPKCEANITTAPNKAGTALITRILCQRCELYGGGFINMGVDKKAIEDAAIQVALFRLNCPRFREESPARKPF